MLDGLWVAGGFNYNWKLWAPTYNGFVCGAHLASFDKPMGGILDEKNLR